MNLNISATTSGADAMLVLSTVSSLDDGKKLAHALVEERLAACVTLQPNVTSVYEWKGAIEEESECLVFIKTRRKRLRALKQRLVELHSYDVPELIALPITDGSRAYLNWVKEQTQA